MPVWRRRCFWKLIGGLAGYADDSVGATDHQGRLGLIVAVTIRTDRFQPLQKAPRAGEGRHEVFDDLKPMPPTQIQGGHHRAGRARHPAAVRCSSNPN